MSGGVSNKEGYHIILLEYRVSEFQSHAYLKRQTTLHPVKDLPVPAPIVRSCLFTCEIFRLSILIGGTNFLSPALAGVFARWYL